VFSAGSYINKTSLRVLDLDSFILEKNWSSFPKRETWFPYVPLCWCSVQIPTMKGLMFGFGDSKNHDWEYHGDIAERGT
jgi:hypothetical protein